MSLLNQIHGYGYQNESSVGMCKIVDVKQGLKCQKHFMTRNEDIDILLFIVNSKFMITCCRLEMELSISLLQKKINTCALFTSRLTHDGVKKGY